MVLEVCLWRNAYVGILPEDYGNREFRDSIFMNFLKVNAIYALYMKMSSYFIFKLP